MAVVQAKQEVVKQDAKVVKEPRIDDKLMGPGKYEVSPDNVFKVKLFLKEKDGRWIIMTGPGKAIDEHEVVFRIWTYDEMIRLRKQATMYDPIKRIHTIDHDSLNRFKVQRLMVSWTFDNENPRLRIQHVNGVMTDESWKAFTNLQPNISTYILEEMNKVYELNG